jgi:DNA-directed RNA polymerase subunit RPC12/RpoP
MKKCIKCKKLLSKQTNRKKLPIRCKSCENKRRYKNLKNHPMFGKKHTKTSKNKMSKNHADRFGKNNPCYIHGKTNTKEYRKIYALKTKFGITKDEYIELLHKQNYRCAICGIKQHKLSRNLAIDHNHKTGKIRGLLCMECNLLLGKAKENFKILIKAIRYLKRENKNE